MTLLGPSAPACLALGFITTHKPPTPDHDNPQAGYWHHLVKYKIHVRHPVLFQCTHQTLFIHCIPVNSLLGSLGYASGFLPQHFAMYYSPLFEWCASIPSPIDLYHAFGPYINYTLDFINANHFFFVEMWWVISGSRMLHAWICTWQIFGDISIQNMTCCTR